MTRSHPVSVLMRSALDELFDDSVLAQSIFHPDSEHDVQTMAEAVELAYFSFESLAAPFADAVRAESMHAPTAFDFNVFMTEELEPLLNRFMQGTYARAARGEELTEIADLSNQKAYAALNTLKCCATNLARLSNCVEKGDSGLHGLLVVGVQIGQLDRAIQEWRSDSMRALAPAIALAHGTSKGGHRSGQIRAASARTPSKAELHSELQAEMAKLTGAESKRRSTAVKRLANRHSVSVDRINQRLREAT